MVIKELFNKPKTVDEEIKEPLKAQTKNKWLYSSR